MTSNDVTLRAGAEPPLDPVGVRRDFQRAYREHPIYAAAIEWHVAERRTAGGIPDFRSPLGHALTYISVNAMQRWFAEHQTEPEPAPF